MLGGVEIGNAAVVIEMEGSTARKWATFRIAQSGPLCYGKGRPVALPGA